MNNPELFDFISSNIGQEIRNYQTVRGGDINEAYRVSTEDQNYFLKLNSYPHGSTMLKQEAKSLRLIHESNTIPVPQVILQESYNTISFLLLKWIEKGEPTPTGWQQFGRQLALMHKTSNPEFGNAEDNYIGSLAQSNKWHDRWSSFYANERLLPQIILAKEKGYLSDSDVSNGESLCSKLHNYCPEESASLIHGDLWGGNYLFNDKSEAILIDPCAYFGHREMDLAMSKLFGGFHPLFYTAYHQHFPLIPGFEERIDVYQLYFLLVHLNLFGTSYLSSCRTILNSYS